MSEPEKPAASQNLLPNTNNDKIDPITALQDGIDSLSLAMFEALRGLRDAVAPESGHLGSNAAPATPGNPTANHSNDNNTTEQPDTDDLWQAYKAGDPEVVHMVQASTNSLSVKITSREDFIRWHAKMEMEKDTELVMKLASTILAKSADIDERVATLPGMHRTRAQQMELLEQLIATNQETARELQEAYTQARQKRDLCRRFIKEKTSEALGIEEELEDMETSR